MAFSSQKKVAILKTKIDNPEWSLRKIGNKHKCSYTTVKKIIKSLPDKITKVDKDEAIVKGIDEIMNNITEITKTRIDNIVGKSDKIEELKIQELKQLEEINGQYFQRKQLLEGKPTDRTEVVHDFSQMTVQELEEYRKKMLGL